MVEAAVCLCYSSGMVLSPHRMVIDEHNIVTLMTISSETLKVSIVYIKCLGCFLTLMFEWQYHCRPELLSQAQVQAVLKSFNQQ
jgi:transcription elongation factor GreA-like protein